MDSNLEDVFVTRDQSQVVLINEEALFDLLRISYIQGDLHERKEMPEILKEVLASNTSNRIQWFRSSIDAMMVFFKIS